MPCRGPDDDYPSSRSHSSHSCDHSECARAYNAMKKQRDEATYAACNLAANVKPDTMLLPKTIKWVADHAKHDEDRARKAFEKYLKEHGADKTATLLGDDNE